MKSNKSEFTKMSSHIDLRTLPLNIPSLCIPRVFPNIDEKRIRRIFDDLALGEIQEIDFVSKKTDKGEPFNRIFVHFRRWFSNRNADTARERLLEGKEIKIIYDDPWFWKVSAYRPPAQPAPRPAQKPARPHIDFDSEEEEDRRPRHKEHHQDRRPTRHQEHHQEENHGRRIKADRKEAQYRNDEFGRDRTLRQDAPRADKDSTTTPPAPAVKPSTATNEYVAIPSQVAKRRIIHKTPNKKPLKIEEEKQSEATANLEEGEIEE